ncbi:hypothetical protein OYC64_005535 [Pagothenia borchgrevinki]|uniref:Uncharacterized protein n=1 Tax=Pagothenia borchgrevinki TaxID=8213 RepID=A0ABD2GGX6_PAGBO
MASINKSSERWSDEEVSALLEIYAEDATQGMLLKAVPELQNVRALFEKVTRPGNRAQRHCMPAKNKETQAGLQKN